SKEVSRTLHIPIRRTIGLSAGRPVDFPDPVPILPRPMADVAPSDPPTSATVVEELRSGRYAVTKTLGGGGQGGTLEAVDKRDGRLVAVKRFRIKGAESWKDVELAEREARVLSSLDHPSLPRYIEHFEESGALYLVMEKIEGETLRELSRRQGSDQQQ